MKKTTEKAEPDFRDVEALARRLCEANHGPGSWDAKHRKRVRYIGQAQLKIAPPPRGKAAWRAFWIAAARDLVGSARRMMRGKPREVQLDLFGGAR